MESPTARYFFDNRVPESEVVVTIRTSQGLRFAVHPEATPQEILGALNRTAEFAFGVGLASIGPARTPPDERP